MKNAETKIPKYVLNKLNSLQRALAEVDQYSTEIEAFVARKTDDYVAMDFYHDNHLDCPFEFNYETTIKALEELL